MMLWSIVYEDEKYGTCLEKLCFMSREETQALCDKMNEEQSEKKYYVKKGETY